MQNFNDPTSGPLFRGISQYKANKDLITARNLAFKTQQELAANGGTAGSSLDNLSQTYSKMLQQEHYQQYPQLGLQAKAEFAKIKYQALGEFNAAEYHQKIQGVKLDFQKTAEEYVQQARMNPEIASALVTDIQQLGRSLVDVTQDPEGTINQVRQFSAQIDAVALDTRSETDPFQTHNDFNAARDYYQQNYGEGFVQQFDQKLSNQTRAALRGAASQIQSAPGSIAKGETVDFQELIQQLGKAQGTIDGAHELVAAAYKAQEMSNFMDRFKHSSPDDLRNAISDEKLEEDKRELLVQRLGAMQNNPHEVLDNLGLFNAKTNLNFNKPQTFALRAKDIQVAGAKINTDLPFMSNREANKLNQALDLMPSQKAAAALDGIFSNIPKDQTYKFAAELRSKLTGVKSETAYLSALNPKFSSFVQKFNATPDNIKDKYDDATLTSTLKDIFPKGERESLSGKAQALKQYLIGNDMSISNADDAAAELYGHIEHDVWGKITTDVPGGAKVVAPVLDKIAENIDNLSKYTNGKPVYADGTELDLTSGGLELVSTGVFGKYQIKQLGLPILTGTGRKAILDLSGVLNEHIISSRQ